MFGNANKKVGEIVYCGNAYGIYDSNGFMAVYDIRKSKIDDYVCRIWISPGWIKRNKIMNNKRLRAQ